MKRGAAGFTLTEFLTVLGIIALLAAVLFPALFVARANARKAACASNLRQIGAAFSQYVSDYDGALPSAVMGSTFTDRKRRATRGTIWAEALHPYTGPSFFTCPARELPGAFAKIAQGPKAQDYITGYAINYRLSEETPLNASAKVARITGKAESRFAYPSLTIVVLEARTGVCAINYPDVYPWRKAWSPEARGKWDGLYPEIWLSGQFLPEIRAQKGGAQRHGGGANYLFADNHVKWLKPEQIGPGAKNDGIHPGFGL